MSERVGFEIERLIDLKNKMVWVWTTLKLFKDILYVGRLQAGVSWIEEGGHEPVVQHKVYVK